VPSVSISGVSEQTANKLRVLSSPVFISLLLATVTLSIFWPVTRCDFIDFDDPDYFSSNAHVLGGLTWANVAWAFTTHFAANWHPLTWLSLMLDAELFGKSPAGPHFTNLLFHTANTVLLFLLLRRLTSAIWRSAFVAALFALHPLHVESVAWISERKDVLSTFFALLTLLSYARYAQRRSRVESRKSGIGSTTFDPRCLSSDYFLALFFFALGLLSKPMLVTLPFVLLLLDWWPLKRMTSVECRESSDKNAVFQFSTFNHLLFEKWPFLMLSGISCVVTFVIQQKGGAVAALTRFSLSDRIENAFVSYARYLGKALWPDPLAVPYPFSEHWELSLVIYSVALMTGLSAIAILFARKFPFALAGWFWFVGTLVPVIGLVQVGAQSMADRYTYLPLIGIFIIVVWGAAEIISEWRMLRRTMIVLTAIVLIACSVRTRNQIGYWQNDGTLFSHALAVTTDNYIACVNLGTWHSKNGRIKETLDCYYRALQMSPDDPSVLYDVGNAFAKLGDWDEAVSDYRRALQIAPDQPDILDNLGVALAANKQFEEAITNFEAALKVKPDYADAHNNLATILSRQGKFEEAGRHFYEALRLEPDDPRICVNLGDTLLRLGNIKAAAACYQQALQLEPDNAAVKAKLQVLGAQPAN
jgi:Flp pilus assembly protein TadD